MRPPWSYLESSVVGEELNQNGNKMKNITRRVNREGKTGIK